MYATEGDHVEGDKVDRYRCIKKETLGKIHKRSFPQRMEDRRTNQE